MGLFKKIGRGIKKAVSSPVGGILRSVGQVALNATGVGGIINTATSIIGSAVGSGRKDDSKSSGGQPVGSPVPVQVAERMHLQQAQALSPPKPSFMARVQSLETSALLTLGGGLAGVFAAIWALKK